jgi:hypothetical protein
MAYTPTKHIMRRVEAALEFDLLGSTGAAPSVDTDVNGGLSSLNPNGSVERVERYLIDVVGAGDLYATVRGTGIACGYSFASDRSGALVSGTEAALTRIVPAEVSIIAVIDSMKGMIGSARGEQIDDVMDDVKRIFSGARRDGADFGVQTVSIGDIQKLDGGSRDAPWVGRTLPIEYRRSERDLQTS